MTPQATADQASAATRADRALRHNVRSRSRKKHPVRCPPATVRVAGLAVGALGGVLAIFALTALRHDIREASGLAAIGIGPYIAIGGCAAMIVGAAMAKRRS